MDKVLSLSLADWFVKIQPAISHIFLFFFFFFLKGRWGRGGQAGGVFPNL